MTQQKHSEVAPALRDPPDCQMCKGSGEIRGMTNHLGPDDYEFDDMCPACWGTGSADPADAVNALGYWNHMGKTVVHRSDVLRLFKARAALASVHPVPAPSAICGHGNGNPNNCPECRPEWFPGEPSHWPATNNPPLPRASTANSQDAGATSLSQTAEAVSREPIEEPQVCSPGRASSEVREQDEHEESRRRQMTQKTMRETFEKDVCVSMVNGALRLGRNSFGNYTDDAVADHWETWQTAWEAASAPPLVASPLVDETERSIQGVQPPLQSPSVEHFRRIGWTMSEDEPFYTRMVDCKTKEAMEQGERYALAQRFDTPVFVPIYTKEQLDAADAEAALVLRGIRVE